MQVALPRYPPPRFPHRCVVCGRGNPGTTAELLAGVPAGRSVRSFDSYSVEVPCCRRCAMVLHARRMAPALVTFGVVISGAMFVVLRERAALVTALIPVAAVLVMAVGLAALERWFPLRFDIAASTDSVTFKFSDLSLGYEFRALNPGAHDPGDLTSA